MRPPPASPSGLLSSGSAGTGLQRLGNQFLRMLPLHLLQVVDPPTQVAMLFDQSLTSAANLIDQRVRILRFLIVHETSSIQRASGLIMTGESKPNRRFITVMCSTLLGFAKCRTFHVKRYLTS